MFEITRLTGQERSSFDCGNADLNEWLRSQSTQQQRRDNAVTFVALDPIDDRVVGYYAALAYQLDLGEAAIAFGVGKRTYPIPALLLARLAVCRSVQGRGLGAQLLVHALAGFARISESVGAEVVVVHAADEIAATFYARYGFIRFASHDLHFYLPTRTIRRLFPD